MAIAEDALIASVVQEDVQIIIANRMHGDHDINLLNTQARLQSGMDVIDQKKTSWRSWLLYLHGMVDLLHVWEETEADILGLLWCAYAKCCVHLVHCEGPDL